MIALLLSVALAQEPQVKITASVKSNFRTSKGIQVSLTEAFKLSEAGEPIFRCREVKAQPNKAGDGLVFKVVD